MRTTLDVDEKTAARLRQLAAAGGVSVDQLLAAYVPGLRSSESSGDATDANDLVSAFDKWAEDFPAETAPLSDEAISRASIYRDR